LDEVTHAVRVAAGRPCLQEAVGRAGGAGARAGLRDVTVSRGGTADDAEAHEAVGGGRLGGTGAGFRPVTGVWEPPAPGSVRVHAVGRTGVVHAVTGLGRVAGSAHGAADGGALRVGRALVVHAVARVDGVALSRGGAARCRALRVGRAERAHARALLGEIADV